MKRINKSSRLDGLFLVWALLVLMTAGCGKSKQQPQPQITVKGFYIGMTAAEVSNSIAKIAGLYEPAAIDNDNVIETGSPVISGRKSNRIYMNFEMDSKTEGHLKAFSWYPDAVAFLFNSRSLNTEEFVQQFANSYNIPKFTSRQTPDGQQQWVYRTPDNIAIMITDFDGIWLTIKRDNTPGTIRNNFN